MNYYTALVLVQSSIIALVVVDRVYWVQTILMHWQAAWATIYFTVIWTGVDFIFRCLHHSGPACTSEPPSEARRFSNVRSIFILSEIQKDTFLHFL